MLNKRGVHDSGDAVVVTGIGAVTPIGIEAEGWWKGAMAAKSAVREVSLFDASPWSTRIAAEVCNFEPSSYIEQRRVRRMDRYSQFAVTAAYMALADAGLAPDAVPSERAGACLGTALAGVAFGESQHEILMTRGPRAVSPMVALSVFPGAGSCNIAIEFGWTGPATANGDSCASAPIALGHAMHYIERGDADVMLAGGAEAPLAPLSFGAFALIRAMSTRNGDPQAASRPFDLGRDGFVMGEGSALLVLERRSHAEKRGARIYAELRSYAMSNDGFHMTAPRSDGSAAARAMREAICRAGLEPQDIAAISAHGSSTPLNDSTETRVIKMVLGDHAGAAPVFATKAMTGHALGATGAFEAALCCQAIHYGILPPTINRTTPDPECDLDYVTEGPRRFTPGPILSNSFGFGGINGCLVFAPA